MMALLENLNNGSFIKRTIEVTTTDLRDASANHLDEDELVDIAYYGNAQGTVFAQRNLGGLRFASPTVLGVFGPIGAIALGDLVH